MLTEIEYHFEISIISILHYTVRFILIALFIGNQEIANWLRSDALRLQML